MVKPQFDIIVIRHGGDGGLGHAVAGDEAARFGGGGGAEKSRMEPGFGVFKRSAQGTHPAGCHASRLKAGIAMAGEILQPGVGMVVEMPLHEP